MQKFFAKLSGRNEVPPVRTDARGQAIFKLSENRQRLFFKIRLEDIRNVTAGHIHLGREGENGPVVVTLFDFSNQPVSIKKAVFTGVITSGDLEGPLAGRPLAALLREMKRGNTYVNVHTVQNPDGEIRGQIFPKKF